MKGKKAFRAVKKACRELGLGRRWLLEMEKKAFREVKEV